MAVGSCGRRFKTAGRTVGAAFQELLDYKVLEGFGAQSIKDGRKIVDMVYEHYSHSDFIAEVKRFNHFANRSESQKEEETEV